MSLFALGLIPRSLSQTLMRWWLLIFGWEDRPALSFVEELGPPSLSFGGSKRSSLLFGIPRSFLRGSLIADYVGVGAGLSRDMFQN